MTTKLEQPKDRKHTVYKRGPTKHQQNKKHPKI